MQTFTIKKLRSLANMTQVQFSDYFDIPLTSIEKFFSQSEDEHMNKVISIDFSSRHSSILA